MRRKKGEKGRREKDRSCLFRRRRGAGRWRSAGVGVGEIGSGQYS